MYGEREGGCECAGECRMYMRTGHTKFTGRLLHSLTDTDYGGISRIFCFPVFISEMNSSDLNLYRSPGTGTLVTSSIPSHPSHYLLLFFATSIVIRLTHSN